MKKKNINVKRLIPFIVIVCVIILVIVVVCTNGKKEVNDEDFGLSGQVSPYKAQENLVSDENTVYQKDIITNEEVLTLEGEEIVNEDLETAKANIEAAIYAMTKEELGLEVEMEETKIFFNEGSTNIYGKNCIVFSLYAQSGDYLKNKGTFAMSSDTNILYKYDSGVMAYKLIKNNNQ